MFYFDTINDKNILKSDLTSDFQFFFTTRESFIKTKEKEMEDTVSQNKKDICEYLNVADLISPEQTHSANISFVEIGKTDYPDCDAMILTNKVQAVFLNFADCTPIILYDSKKHIAAISHAGWRGTVQKIVIKTIEKMGSEPKDILAIIGPAISKGSYNVGEDVFNQLKSTVNDFTGLSQIKSAETFVDLKGINARQLEEFGVEKIDICPYCTCCDNDMFFSYRKEEGTTNRHNAVIRL